MKFVVAGIEGTNKLLEQADHGIGAVISMLDPDSYPARRPHLLDTIPNRLELQFDDTEKEMEGYTCPTTQEAQDIVEFITAGLASGVQSWLFQCHMGKSRSAACGLLFSALTVGIDNAKAELVNSALSRQVAPNTLLCEYFDQICGFDGKLAKLAWDFDFQLLKKMAQHYFDTEGEGV